MRIALLCALLVACGSPSADDPEPTPEPAVEGATAQELIDAVQLRLCEADQACEMPASSSIRSCECAGITGPAVSEVDPQAARACIDALPEAAVEPCDPFDLTKLPDVCWDVLVGPDAPLEVFVFATNARGLSTSRDCGAPPHHLCDEPRYLNDCEPNLENLEACYTGEWTCDNNYDFARMPSACFDAMTCAPL